MSTPELERLLMYLRELAPRGIALAFSGGTDSSVLLKALTMVRAERAFPLTAYTMHSVLMKPGELVRARAAGVLAGVEHLVLEHDPLSIPEVRDNMFDRCYFCKREIFRTFQTLASQHGLGVVLDGTNADDLGEYRPGLRALAELGIRSPLAELGLPKAKIRTLAREMNLPCAGQASSPCLATRFEYGTRLTGEAVRRAAEGEDGLRRLLPEAHDLRLRVHGTVARIEVPSDLLPQAAARRTALTELLKRLGFAYVTLDLEGFRSGSMDAVLSRSKRKKAK